MNAATALKSPTSKIEATAGSTNFMTSLITLAILALNVAGAAIPEDTGEIIGDAVNSGNMMTLLSVLIPNVINPILKVIKNGGFKFSRIKTSWNFWTQMATVALMSLSAWGLAFPEGAAANVMEAIQLGSFQAIVLAVVINILNPLYHFFFDRKPKAIKN